MAHAPALTARRTSLLGGDNALAESINGLQETEAIGRQGPWRNVDAVELATAEWVDWYNHRRLNEYCGDVPPTVLEQVHHAHQQPPAASWAGRTTKSPDTPGRLTAAPAAPGGTDP